MPAKSIIALCGPIGCGKSTLADLLIDEHKYIRLSFAAPIKQMIKTILNMQGLHREIVTRMLWGDLKNEPSEYLSGRTPRHIMQTLGTEWRDLQDKHFWTNIWKRAAQFVDKIIIDDMRFTHEAETIEQLGGIIFRIERPNCGSSSHISEREYLEIQPNFTIINDKMNDPRNMLLQVRALIGPSL